MSDFSAQCRLREQEVLEALLTELYALIPRRRRCIDGTDDSGWERTDVDRVITSRLKTGIDIITR